MWELMIVLVIVALTMGIVAPRVVGGRKHMEDLEFLQEFVHTLRRARLSAMNSGQMTRFRIRGAEGLYGIELPPRKVIPDNVDLFADHLQSDPGTGDHLVVFYPDGSLSGSDMEIVFDRERTYRIDIHPVTGVVRLSREKSK